MSIDPLDLEYNPRIGVPDIPGIFARWQNGSREARERLTHELDLRYGPAPAETLDFFPAPGTNRPLLLNIVFAAKTAAMESASSLWPRKGTEVRSPASSESPAK